MPILLELIIIIALLAIIAEGVWGFLTLLSKASIGILRRTIRIFCMAIVFILLLAHFVVPKIAYEALGGKEAIAKLSPKWLPSDQPDILRLEKQEKWALFASQADLFTKMIAYNVVHFPALAFNYFVNPKTVLEIDKAFFGISIDPTKNSMQEIMPKLKELGAKSVLIRLNYEKNLFSSQQYEAVKQSAKILKEYGYIPLIVIAQNRDIFSDNIDLNLYFEQIFKDFSPFVAQFQIGETINRPKWGVIRLGEYEQFFNAAKTQRDKIAPNAKLIAPSVIDFEWLYTVYYANVISDFDILNSLLYVDRVGYPENTQMGADTISKIRLMHAVKSDKPFYITEFNWPLSGTADYKPTSDEEAVNEFLHACYNVRYTLLAIGSNQVDKIYYWQLFANGYGLIDHLSSNSKPAFSAYKTVIDVFSGAKNPVLSKINEKCYSLKAQKGAQLEALWCTSDTGQKLNVESGSKSYDMFGFEIKNPLLGIAPVYIIK